jgi:hypothetical protein
MEGKLGTRARDRGTGIDGTLIAYTTWHDRSAECAILRDGVDSDGRAWDVHWFPASRLEAA